MDAAMNKLAGVALLIQLFGLVIIVIAFETQKPVYLNMAAQSLATALLWIAWMKK
jgi:hypothetical protein